jgi:signal transduction histidine kinase
MHAVLARQLKRAGLAHDAPPADASAWSSLLQAIDRAYAQADDDRYLLERSLALSSEEMGELHGQLAAERDTISTVICSLAEGVCAVDEDGAILFINPEARRLLRLHHHEALVGRNLGAIVRAATPDGRTLDAIRRDAASRRIEESRLIVAGDESMCITCAIAPLGQTREGLVITLRDVTERTRLEAERAELNRRLLETSRQAGMAEVASGVLHNVGNVLNSVNVSATLATDVIEGSKVAAVAQVARLLDTNRPRLAEFLNNDPAGARVPEYLTLLAQRLEQERSEALAELAHLRTNIDHIREIVATQQAYARGGGAGGAGGVGMHERQQISALVEEALRITEASLIRHGVEVVRDFQPMPPVLVERHHILQILINLITNAKQAATDKPANDRRITISVKRGRGENAGAPANGSEMVLVRVADNGVGIAPENLTRVFQHGFTTRKDGHGFGLHSAALAAKAMGGSLHAESDGPGRGAAFTLVIPADVPQAMRAAA